MESYKEGKSKETIKINFTSNGNFGYMLISTFLGNQIIIIQCLCICLYTFLTSYKDFLSFCRIFKNLILKGCA